VIEQSQKVETFILGFQSTLGPKPTLCRMCGVQNKLEQTFVQLEGFQLDFRSPLNANATLVQSVLTRANTNASTMAKLLYFANLYQEWDRVCRSQSLEILG